MIRIQFDYLNHNGVLSRRDLEVDALEFQYKPGFGYQPGWFISGFDHNKAARRSFALSRIILEEYPSNGDRTNVVIRLFTMKR